METYHVLTWLWVSSVSLLYILSMYHLLWKESNDDFGYVPAKSNLQRGKNVIRRKRSMNSQDKSRRTGSDFTSSFPQPAKTSQELETQLEINPSSIVTNSL